MVHTKQDDVTKCDIVLVYHGGNGFQDYLIMTTQEFAKVEQSVAHVQAHFDELALQENVQNMHRKKAKEYQHRVDRIESSSEEEDNDSHGNTTEEDLDLEKFMEEEEGIANTLQQLIPQGMDMTKKKEPDNMQKGNNMQNDGTVKPKPKNQNNVQKTDDPPQPEPGTSVQKENSDEANKDQANSSKDESSTPQDSESESGLSEESEAANNMQNKRKRTGSQPKPTRVFFKQYHCLSGGCKVTKQRQLWSNI